MRTKNAKRLWPVPATLTVVALAAFLAFGLMAITGAQPAAAQSSADCEVEVVIAADSVNPTVTDKIAGNNPEHCQAKGGTATVKFTGPDVVVMDREGPGKLDLLIQDDNGPIRAYLNDYVDYDTGTSMYAITNMGDTLGTVGAEPPEPMRFRIQAIEVPLAERNALGQYEAQSVTVTVSGNVYIYESGAILTNVIETVPDDSTDKRNEITLTTDEVVIVFLGAPVLGEDGDDANKIVDDEQQCVNSAGDAIERPTAGCADSFPNPDTTDAAESKSKLIAVGGASPIAVLDGKSKDYTLTNQTTVTIYALIEDAKGQALPDTEVNFTATIEPSTLELDFDVDRDVDAETVGTATAEGELDISSTAGIDNEDAVAERMIEGLPTDKAYRITVNVTVGSLDLGSIVVTRHGEPAEIKAAVYNEACITPVGTDDDYANDNIKLDNDDCAEDYRFGEGQVVVVKAHLEDTLGSVVAGNLSVKLGDVDNPLDTDKPVELLQPILSNENPVAWVYMVDKAAMLGSHMITVSTTETDKDENAIASVPLTVSVAGPPLEYMISGPDNIDLGGRATFTVTALDANKGAPHFTMDDEGTRNVDESNNKVEVVVPDMAESLVRGRMLDNGVLTLDADTGMGSFTIYAPSNAPDGSTARIFVSAGDVEITHTVMFGEALMMPGMPMNVMAMATSHDMITVSWDAVMDATSYMVERGYMDADNMMMWMTVAEMTTDMMHMDSGLMAETTYYYRVTAMNDAGYGDASDGMAMAMTMTMAEGMPVLTAPMDVSVSTLTNSITVNWTPDSAQNATQIKAALFNAELTRIVDLKAFNPAARDPGIATFTNVAPGMYKLVVASFRPGEPHMWEGMPHVVEIQ